MNRRPPNASSTAGAKNTSITKFRARWRIEPWRNMYVTAPHGRVRASTGSKAQKRVNAGLVNRVSCRTYTRRLAARSRRTHGVRLNEDCGPMTGLFPHRLTVVPTPPSHPVRGRGQAADPLAQLRELDAGGAGRLGIERRGRHSRQGVGFQAKDV